MKILKRLLKWINESLLLISLIAFITLIIIGTYSSRYQSFEKEFVGIEFSLNEEVYIEKLLIFDGKLSDPIIGSKRFEGRIIYGEEIYETSLRFKNNRDYILNFDGGNTPDKALRQIYIDDNFYNIVITIYEKTPGNTMSWNNNTGLVFVTPASDIKEGSAIFELLYEGYNPGE
ncbi:MAG: hypothetical protein JEZ08_04095 [Clostridiales bacterium]|nr:hypothetical protein [Clostridiales bacterium]